MKKIDLPTLSRQKSYYGKAIVTETERKGITRCDLYSYETLVATILHNDKASIFQRKWSGYSATTMKHINSFRLLYGFQTISKKDWENMKVKELKGE